MALYIKDKYKVIVARLLIFPAGTIEEFRNTCKGKWRWAATVEGLGAYREEMGSLDLRMLSGCCNKVINFYSSDH